MSGNRVVCGSAISSVYQVSDEKQDVVNLAEITKNIDGLVSKMVISGRYTVSDVSYVVKKRLELSYLKSKLIDGSGAKPIPLMGEFEEKEEVSVLPEIADKLGVLVSKMDNSGLYPRFDGSCTIEERRKFFGLKDEPIAGSGTLPTPLMGKFEEKEEDKDLVALKKRHDVTLKMVEGIPKLIKKEIIGGADTKGKIIANLEGGLAELKVILKKLECDIECFKRSD
jgi:hypothetical protein